jgi:hypothetical protein
MIIRSGNADTLATVDPTSNALHHTDYDLLGHSMCSKRTYAACTISGQTAAWNTAAPALCLYGAIQGVSGTVIRIQRVLVCATVSTATQYIEVGLLWDSNPPPMVFDNPLTPVPYDSTSQPSVVANVGTFLGASVTTSANVLMSINQFVPLSTSTIVNRFFDFDLRRKSENSAIVLRNPLETLEVAQITAGTNVPTFTLMFVWTEE